LPFPAFCGSRTSVACGCIAPVSAFILLFKLVDSNYTKVFIVIYPYLPIMYCDHFHPLSITLSFPSSPPFKNNFMGFVTLFSYFNHIHPHHLLLLPSQLQIVSLLHTCYFLFRSSFHI
jgi:hypothetical protein